MAKVRKTSKINPLQWANNPSISFNCMETAMKEPVNAVARDGEVMVQGENPNNTIPMDQSREDIGH